MSFNWVKAWRKVRHKKNVVAISGTLKPRIKNGVEVDEQCIRVYVSKKESLSALSKRDIIPRKIMEIPTDVVETNVFYAPPKPLKHDLRSRIRPAPSGCSAIYQCGSACTLGWFARDRTDNQIVVVSNNHCTAAENKLPIGHPYLQPSPYDGGTLEDQLGELKRYVPIKFNKYTCPFRRVFTLQPLKRIFYRFGLADPPVNRVDAGAVSVNPNDIHLSVLGIGKLNGKRRGEIGEKAEKVGRTTGHTVDGVLTDNDWYGYVQYSRGQAFFGPCGLIEKNNFSAGGDSSSAIVWMRDKKFAGLLFAGSTTHTLFCHWDLIEEELNVDFIW